jgi:hypothetical protein
MYKLILVTTVIFLITTALPFAGCQSRCSKDMSTSIGEFESKEAGIHAAIPRLAAEIRRCPEAEVYRIMWAGPGDYYGNYRHAVLYDRRSKRVGYEDDFLSGFSGKTYSIDDKAVRVVAEKSGTMEDFSACDQSH